MLALLLAATIAASSPADPRRDFDFETGTWSINITRLAHPLSGSKTWLHPHGFLHIVRKLWDGASLAQLEATKPTPHFLGLMLRMYDAKRQQWSVYWGSADTGALDPPLIGSFANGRGEFRNHETIEGQDVLVRVIYSNISQDAFRTEQAFSADGGKTWEPNLIQTFTRIK